MYWWKHLLVVLRPSSEDMNGQVRSIDAMYRSIEGGVGVLRNQAQSFARDAGNLLKVYGAGLSDMGRCAVEPGEPH